MLQDTPVRERDETAFKTLLPIYEKSIPEETRKGIGVGAAGSEDEEEAGAKIAAIIATLYPQMNKDTTNSSQTTNQQNNQKTRQTSVKRYC